MNALVDIEAEATWGSTLEAPRVWTEGDQWPPDYTKVFAWRQAQMMKFAENPDLIHGALEYYRTRPVEFIVHWVSTYDPRKAAAGGLANMPFVLFEKQAEYIEFVMACLENGVDGLIEKCRDAGITWASCGLSIWLWLFRDGISVGWGSRKEALVDKIGDPDSIFQKMRFIMDELPRFFWPEGFTLREHATFMKIINPENGSTITGEGGDNIGRGGRSAVYFKDESAHYPRPELIEAALGDNTNTQIDISSVNGTGNVFHTKRENGKEWAQGQEVSHVSTNVFIMDWRDHPAKTQEWYDRRKQKFENDGLSHVFAQEVERNYAASVQGTIINSDWVTAAIDAHLKVEGDWGTDRHGSLDVADGGVDKNAYTERTGNVLRVVDVYKSRDPGYAARTTVAHARKGATDILVQYDAIGVGAAVKSEINRLDEVGDLPDSVTFAQWIASAKVKDPDELVIEEDEEEGTQKITNKEFYENRKAQGWRELGRRFYKTYMTITGESVYPVDELISISSEVENIETLKKELCQPTSGLSSRLKYLVNKQPKGTKSPNIADSVMMLYSPEVKPLNMWDVI